MQEDVKSIARQFYEEWNKGNIDGCAALFDENVIDHNPFPNQKPGRAGVKESLQVFAKAFPDMKLSAEEIIAEGDKVVDRGIGRGTHKGDLLGIPPTNTPVTLSFTNIYRVKNGKINEAWHIEDVAGVMQQITRQH